MLIAKYKYDHNIYADLVPVFNDGYSGYSITDEITEDGSYTIRTIECDTLPTNMYFGLHNSSNTVTNRELSLISIEYLDVSQCTDIGQLCRKCHNVESVNCGDWDTRNLEGILWLFEGCNKLKSVDVRNFNTSKIQRIGAAFSGCTSLTSLDLSLWDTSKVDNLMYLFASCISLVTLDISNMVIPEGNSVEGFFTEGCTSLKYIKCNIPDTIQIIAPLLPTRTSDDLGVIIYQGTGTLPQEIIDTLNSRGWTVNTNPTLIAEYKYDSTIYKNLIPVFNEGYTGFVEDEEVDENGVVTRVIEHVELPTYMRFGETWDTSQNIPTPRSSSLIELLQVNDNNISIFDSMFKCCNNLRSVCKLNLISTALTNLFFRCYNLEKLDLSNNTFSNTENINYIFTDCSKLTSLDISNSNLNKCKAFNDAFINNISLTDIGMIYCDQSTINKVASLLPTDHNVTIWVESDDILQYDQYDHITYKTQKVQDTVHLNSPLLKGDTIEVIDGKTYHVHRWEKVVLDGSEDEGWRIQDTYQENNTVCFTHSNLPYSKKAGELNFTNDRFINYRNYPLQTEIFKEGFSINTSAEYGKFAYIRLDISRLPALTLDNFKQWLSENPTTVIYELATPYYELISEEPLELTLLDTTDNTINNNSILPSNMTIANKELSTIAIKPSTTYTLAFDKSNVDSQITIDICGGEQVTTVLNRVELTTPSELGSGIRFLSSDGCIISNVRLLEGSLVESAIPKESFEGLQSSFEDGYIPENLVPNGTRYISTETARVTNLTKVIKAGTPITIVFNTKQASPSIRACFSFESENNSSKDYIGTYENVSYGIETGFNALVATFDFDVHHINVWWHTVESIIEYDNIMIFEGDWTHLTEEDFNNLGKYKVEYKVTGKNKFDGELEHGNINNSTGALQISDQMVRNVNPIKVNSLCNYTISNDLGYNNYVYEYDRDMNFIRFTPIRTNPVCFTTCSNTEYINIRSTSDEIQNDLNVKYQIEEGSVATEYEPYKEDIKTYYLSSPFLEGDTIEDVNGVATHVKRYEKIVLDGSEGEWEPMGNNTTERSTTFMLRNDLVSNALYNPPCLCDNFYQDMTPGLIIAEDSMRITEYSSIQRVFLVLSADRVAKNDINGFKQWLQANPTTVVYSLRSPQYEPISEESILCDSYVGGHLDFNSAVPVGKVEFTLQILDTRYLQPNTRYKIQFESDNVGKIDRINLAGMAGCFDSNVVKGVNIFEITTPAELIYGKALSIHGIGFNASNIQVVACDKDKDFDYFKGLQSSFESCYPGGKNLFDGELEQGMLATSNGIFITSSDWVSSANYIKVEPNTSYFTSGDIVNCIFEYDDKFNYIGYIGETYSDVSYKFTTGSKTKYIKFRCYLLENYKGNPIQIEKGTQATSYEPFIDKYKVECKIVGKNLFDNQWQYGFLADATGIINENPLSGRSSKNFIEIHTSRYAFSYTSPLPTSPSIYFYDKNYIYLGNIYLGNKSTFTIPYNEAKYMKFRLYRAQGDLPDGFENFTAQLEEGTVATSYEPYKEYTKTLYLNSPLLKGDTIEVHNGKLCHYHKMGIEILDGSEDWEADTFFEEYVYFYKSMSDPKLSQLPICDRFIGVRVGNVITSENIFIYSSGNLNIGINRSKLQTTDVNGFKQWLSNNPTTVVYELAEPYYEEIEPTQEVNDLPLCNSVTDIDYNTVVPVAIDVTNKAYPVLIKPNTLYTIAFTKGSEAIEVDLGGTIALTSSDRLTVTTPATLQHSNLYLYSKGTSISNVILLEGDHTATLPAYFEGLQSSFEGELVTDENDENYGKYKVDVKVVGKNKFDIPTDYSKELEWKLNSLSAVVVSCSKVKPNTDYVISGSYSKSDPVAGHGGIAFIRTNEVLPPEVGWFPWNTGSTADSLEFDLNVIWATENPSSTNMTIKFNSQNFMYVYTVIGVATSSEHNHTAILSNLQLEEGTEATSYEPYKESIYTLYLNSPLLKDDEIKVQDGKLCHYHKMSKVVLDGSENWGIYTNYTNDSYFSAYHIINEDIISNQGYCDKFLYKFLSSNVESVDTFNVNNTNYVPRLIIKKSKLSTPDLDGLKQWLSENPTTVVYKLAEPLYEDITPLQDSIVLTSVAEGDLLFNTIIPVNTQLVYSTNISSVSVIESNQDETDALAVDNAVNIAMMQLLM